MSKKVIIQSKQKKRKLLNGKTFQVNLERNDNKSGSILCGNKINLFA